MDRRSFILGTAVTAGAAMVTKVMPSATAAEIPTGLVDSRTAGRADARSGIQRVIDTSHRVLIGPGDHRCDGPLLVDEGTVIYLAPGARLIKNFSASGAMRNAFIQNRRWGTGGPEGVTKVHDVWIGGPGTLTAASPAERGNLISLFGDRITLRDFTTDVWQGGRHTVLAGDDCRATDVTMRGGGGSTGNGGLRFQGGRGFIGTGLYCESGDDAFQFVPAGAPADPTYGMDIEDSVYIGCTGSSSHAKLVVIGLQLGGSNGAPDGRVTMASSVRRSGFVNCAAPDGAAVTSRIQNISSSGVIEDCYIEDLTTVGLPSTTGGVELLVNAWEDTGGISRMRISGVTMRSLRQPVAIKRGGVDVTFARCSFRRGSNATMSPVAELSGIRTLLTRCTFDGAGSRAPVVTVERPENGGGPSPSLVTFDRCRFLGVNGVGVDLQAGDRTWLDGCVFEGQGTAVRTGPAATRTRYSDNDFGTLTARSRG
jgi:hypothetical protein